MRSEVLRRTFALHGVEARSPATRRGRASVLEIITDLQRGQIAGVARRIADAASFGNSHFGSQPLVCLACTELPLAFSAFQSQLMFERDGVTYLNTPIVHIEATLEQAIGEPRFESLGKHL